MQRHMDIVVRLGSGYGLQINWGKVELLAIPCAPIIKDGSGENLKCKTSIGYLGALVDSSGNIHSELNRRIGMASSDFKSLTKIWNHTNLTRAKKYRIYSACILSKLLYGLQTAWLTKLQRRRLDGFHARCIRKLAGIKHSFWSRVSNSEVLGLVDARPLSSYLLEHQLKYFGTLFRKADTDIGRKLVFKPSSDHLVHADFRRRRGRPRMAWAVEVRKHALEIVGEQNLSQAMQVHTAWRTSVRKYCTNKGTH